MASSIQKKPRGGVQDFDSSGSWRWGEFSVASRSSLSESMLCDASDRVEREARMTTRRISHISRQLVKRRSVHAEYALRDTILRYLMISSTFGQLFRSRMRYKGSLAEGDNVNFGEICIDCCLSEK